MKLLRQGHEFRVEEKVHEIPLSSPRTQLLNAENGEGSWWSGEKVAEVNLKQPPSVCALAAASADGSFPAREVAEFVGRWGFFDPNPFLLRRDWNLSDSGRFDPYGRNLGETLYALDKSSPEVLQTIVSATRSIVGLPRDIEVRESEDRFYFVQEEPGLKFRVNQMGVSSGTLRMLALMTALYSQPEAALIGIEEPENYIHPAALSSFAEHVLDARNRVQFMVTTHSPMLLDILDDPAAVNIVSRNDTEGTLVVKEERPRRRKEIVGCFGLRPWRVLRDQRLRRLTEVSKNVVVIAPGETERRALPHLLDHLQDRDIRVRIPPRHRALNAKMALKLIQASLYDYGDRPPDNTSY